jgi:hypothetical protein
VYDNGGVREALGEAEAVLADCVDAPAWSLSDVDLTECVTAAERIRSRVNAIMAHLVREIDGRGPAATAHASSTMVWLRETLRIGTGNARDLVTLGAALARSPSLDRAIGAAAVNPEQAAVIAAATADLTRANEVGPELVDKAEATLIDFAVQFPPKPLAKIADRILTYIAPQIAEEIEAKRLAKQDKEANRARAFTLTDTGDGKVRFSGWLTTVDAATVTAAIDPLSAPKPDDLRTPTQRRADALVEVCDKALADGELPDHGGDRPQVVVTVAYEVLRRELDTATLDTGARITPDQARRLACDAQLIPAVLGGDRAVLDLGHSRRLFTGALRRALVLRDGGCAFPGCDRPARWCSGHHIRHWSDGGDTSLDNAVLLCGFHHCTIHRGHWEVRLATDGRPRFIPPPYIDPERRPRQNHYHRRQ